MQPRQQEKYWESSWFFFDRNLETLKNSSCAEKAAKIRKTEERAKTNLLTKQKYSFDSNGKLANCEKKDPSQCEIFIVEGDLQAVLQRQPVTVIIRQSFQSGARF